MILSGYLPAEELAGARNELDLMFPSANSFHDGADPRRDRYIGDEFAGIDHFPFASTELSLLAVHPRLIRLAETLLGDDDIRIYSAEAWAKYTGAADYDQDLHRDYLNHTVLVPASTPDFQQLEMFVYLIDVPEELGPPHFVPRALTADLPPKPNWYPRTGIAAVEGGFVAANGADARRNSALVSSDLLASGRPGDDAGGYSASLIDPPGMAGPATQPDGRERAGGVMSTVPLRHEPACCCDWRIGLTRQPESRANC